MPAALAPALAQDAVLIAGRILNALDYVGVIGVEMFVTADGLVVNEIAPRVHNSGHWTEAACLIDQFEQHVRAICGWPLGDGARHSDARDAEPARRRCGDGAGAARRPRASLRQGRGAARAQDGPPDPDRPEDAVSSPRLAVRAVIVEAGRLLLVNAYPGDDSDLWCAPGGGVERGASLQDNLRREVREETGLGIAPGRLLAVSEFHDPDAGFHQVDLFFRARLLDAAGGAVANDPAGVVNRLRWVDARAMAALRVKPDCLAGIAFGPDGPVVYDPLERLAR